MRAAAECYKPVPVLDTLRTPMICFLCMYFFGEGTQEMRRLNRLLFRTVKEYAYETPLSEDSQPAFDRPCAVSLFSGGAGQNGGGMAGWV